MRLLVVDDDRALRDVLRRALTLSGYEVVLSATGSEALSEVTTSVPDAVVLDVGLPDIDGLEVLTAIREVSSVPVIIMTVRTDARSIKDSLALGATEYMNKPFKPETLLRRINALSAQMTG